MSTTGPNESIGLERVDDPDAQEGWAGLEVFRVQPINAGAGACRDQQRVPKGDTVVTTEAEGHFQHRRVGHHKGKSGPQDGGGLRCVERRKTPILQFGDDRRELAQHLPEQDRVIGRQPIQKREGLWPLDGF